MQSSLGVALLALFQAVLALPAWALDMAEYVVAHEVTGVVVDAGSGKPIPGAVVAIRFERNNTGHSSPHCFRSTAVETDADGRFRFAPWKQEDTKANATFGQVTAYKAGYSVPRPVVLKQARRDIAGIAFSDTIKIPASDVRLEVKRFFGSPEERMQQLGPLLSQFVCRWQAEFDDAKLLTSVSGEIRSTSVADVKMPGGSTAGKWVEGYLKGLTGK
jgi:hypothetical protein